MFLNWLRRIYLPSSCAGLLQAHCRPIAGLQRRAAMVNTPFKFPFWPPKTHTLIWKRPALLCMISKQYQEFLMKPVISYDGKDLWYHMPTISWKCLWYHTKTMYNIKNSWWQDIASDIIGKIIWNLQWYHALSWFMNLWYHSLASMILRTCGIIWKWYHRQ